MDKLMQRGHCGIGIYEGAYKTNIGSLIRSASCFGANYVFTIGDEYDGSIPAVGHDRHFPVFRFDSLRDLQEKIPDNTDIIAVEITETSRSLPEFIHPERAVYLLGPEGGSIPDPILEEYEVVEIPSDFCLNVAVAGGCVLYDRVLKQYPYKTQGERIGEFVSEGD